MLLLLGRSYTKIWGRENFQWVFYVPKGRNSPDTDFFSVALIIWRGSEVNFPLELLTYLKAVFWGIGCGFRVFYLKKLIIRVCWQIFRKLFPKFNLKKIKILIFQNRGKNSKFQKNNRNFHILELKNKKYHEQIWNFLNN